ncbi:Argininosuccinate lyase [Platanthera guangdongensis]|uniref:Argininosuccinate lyase n=1 Tax=Platanthera guangdongensis TaxID=2320717 RepID=A0ABR2N4M0_9ASPA
MMSEMRSLLHPNDSSIPSFLLPRLSSAAVRHPQSAANLRFRSQLQSMTSSSSAASTASSDRSLKPKEEKPLWGGRFEESITDAVERFTESVSFDKQLYKHDIMGSRAHATMLAHQGLITANDSYQILSGLDEIERRIDAGEFIWRKDREDVHMNIEAELTNMIGEPAKKLHTARSRNDQVTTDLRLWCREAIDKIHARVRHLQVALVKLAVKNEGLIVPGYTHLQRAQPVLLQHHLLSYVEQLDHDIGRLINCKDRMNFCPLGSCALAGTGLPIDRFMTSNYLGFTAPMRNSIDAVSDRDFVLEFISLNSIIAIHLSSLSEEWVLWGSKEFGFSTPNDSVSTGSNIMPQKKNPDPMELEKSSRVIGSLMTLLVLCKGLPLAYNRDLQEDKEPLFDSVKTILDILEVSAEFAQNFTFNHAKIEKALPSGHLDAAILGDYLVKKGLMTPIDRDQTLPGLDEIERRIDTGEFIWRKDTEDVRVNIEAELTNMIGKPANKLDTARSRNDQVLTDLRLWCREAIDKIHARLGHLQVALVKLAIKNEGLIVPGYTHLQRAQPVLLQHHLLAYVEQLDRDIGRLINCKDRMNFCPLPIEMFMTSNDLEFTESMRNSIDVVSNRGFVLEFISANSIIAIHLSRLGEEWVLWASEEFGFLTPSDSVSTGSSIMPQKKNPDPMELVRGKSSRVIGNLITILVLCKGLPQAYNCVLQEVKELLSDSVNTIIGMLEVSAEFAQNITFNHAKIEKALPAGHLDATTLADYLVKKVV